MKVDLQVVEPDQFGNVLQHLTGSKAHNVQLREAAVRRGPARLPVRDPRRRDGGDDPLRDRGGGLRDARLRTGSRPSCARAAGSSRRRAWTAARACRSSSTVEDLKGDLHCHTTLSDGRNSAEQMARGAMARGLEYLAITDHSARTASATPSPPSSCSSRSSRCASSTPRSTASSC